MDKQKENKRLLFLSDLFDYSLKNSFIDTVSYLGSNSRRLISNLSLFVSIELGTRKCFIYTHRKVKKNYLSRIQESIREFALNNSIDLKPSEYQLAIHPKEEFIGSEGPNEPNFSLTIPIFAQGKLRALINFSTSGPVNPEENDIPYINLIADFLSALWEREIREIEERRNIEKLAFVDSLTGAFNRHAFYQLFPQDIAEARRNGSALSLAIFDVDGFKQINDSYGHSFGDMILKQVSAQFKKLLREEDKVFRLGGDEFAAIMKTDKKEAYIALERIIREISITRNVRVTLSGGIVEINPYKTPGADEVLRQADRALYFAKERGKNQIFFHEDENTQTKPDQFPFDEEIKRLTQDINIRLKEFATEQLASFYSSLSKDVQLLCQKPVGVSNYALYLGRELNLPESRLQNLRLGAILYDIGMIAVPQKIVLKNSRLTPDEYELVKHHTIIGGRMIQQFTVLREVLAIVLYHHEWVNGQGYPFGLAGEYIPLEARIIAVADAFHAMHSHRPYRTALRTEESISELIRGRGIKYDPQVVEAFLSLVDKRIITTQ